MTLEKILEAAPAPLSAMIKNVQFYQWPNSTAISCNVTLLNGHQIVGTSRPRIDTSFDQEKGEHAAFTQTFDDLWKISAYQERDSTFPGIINVQIRKNRAIAPVVRDYGAKFEI